MTSQPRSERNMPALLEDLYLGPSPDYRDDLLAAVGRTRQRPVWTFPERWLPMDFTMRLAPMARLPLRRVGAVALIVLLLGALVAVYIGSQRRVPLPFGPAANGLMPVTRGGDLYLVNVETGDGRLILGGATDDHDPDFSPDGTQIAFLRGESEIWVIRADGTDPHRIGDGPIEELTWAQWAPDSRHLTVTGRFDGRLQLQLLDARGSEAPKVLAANYIPDQVVFRPPLADQILFRAVPRAHPGFMGLFVMDADGENIRTLIQPTVPVSINLDMDWLRYTQDGQRILYNHHNDSSNQMQLWVMNADGTNAKQFVHVESSQDWEGEANVSPDGRLVAFWRSVAGGGRISIVRADGTGPAVDTGPLFATTTSFVWAPDSTKLLVIPAGDGRVRPYLLDPSGGPGEQLSFDLEPAVPGDYFWQRLAN